MDRVTIQPAKVVDGVVEILQGGEYIQAPDVVILGAGQADSIGFVLISENGAEYITNTQVDAAFMLEKMSEICDKIIDIGNTTTFAIPSVGIAPNLELQAVAVTTQTLKESIEIKELT
jgi:hypothetical protein